jgi:hypothetical protein
MGSKLKKDAKPQRHSYNVQGRWIWSEPSSPVFFKGGQRAQTILRLVTNRSLIGSKCKGGRGTVSGFTAAKPDAFLLRSAERGETSKRTDHTWKRDEFLMKACVTRRQAMARAPRSADRNPNTLSLQRGPVQETHRQLLPFLPRFEPCCTSFSFFPCFTILSCNKYVCNTLIMKEPNECRVMENGTRQKRVANFTERSLRTDFGTAKAWGVHEVSSVPITFRNLYVLLMRRLLKDVKRDIT